MEHLEKYIKDRREEFDCEMPDLEVWANIDRQLEKKSHRRIVMWKVWSMAASIALLVVSGWLSYVYLQGNAIDHQGIVASLSPEHAEIEAFYQNQVAERTRVLVSLQHEGLQKVQEDLARMDDAFDELVQEYKKLPMGSQEIMIEAMLENYKTKLEILETVLEKIKENDPGIEVPERDFKSNEKPENTLTNEEGYAI